MVKKGKAPAEAEIAEEVENVEKPAVEEAPVDTPAAEEEPAVVEAPGNKKKKAAAAAVKENGAADAEAPVENGVTEEKKVTEDGEKKKTPKPVKKVVPVWASISDEARKNLSKGKLPKPKVQDAVLAAMAACADSKGIVSAGAIRKFVMEENPDLPKMILKKAVAKAIERGLIKQVKGKGFGGSFKLESAKNTAKVAKTAAKSKGGKGKVAAGPRNAPLEDAFPGVFTWACNPKEASVPLIRKYLTKHYPELDVVENPKQFKKALESGEKKGQLRRVTGQGFNGTFALVDEADKTGAKFEDALENAIIAMSEPKQVSVNSLRDYLSVYHPEYNTDQRPTVLKNALERSVAKGWLKQISGKGFAGTYRLMHPYYPSPRELWGNLFVEKKKKDETSTPKRKATKRPAADSDSDDDEEDSDDDDAEVLPTPKKRGAPTPRKTAVPVKKAAKKEAKKVVKKTKSAGKKGKKVKK